MKDAVDKFAPFLKAFATGPKGNRDLTFKEAKEATSMILNQELPKELVGAFLMTWRVKEESIDEISAALEALKERALPLDPLPNSIEIAMPMEGKKKNIPLLILVADYLKDTQFVITSSPKMKDKAPLSMLNLVEYFPKNIHLVSRDNYLPQLEALHELRDNLQLRTVFNTLEKLHHPLQSKYAVIGAHHGPYFKKYEQIFSSQYQRMSIVQGDEGCGEIIKKSKIHIIEKGKKVEELLIDPKEFDIHFEKPTERLSLDQAKKEIFNPSRSILDLARLNAAIYCYTIDPASSIEAYFLNL